MNEQAPGTQPDHQKKNRKNRKPGDSETALVLSFIGIFVLLGLLAFWPYTKQYIPGLADPPRVQLLGAIERTSFVGGLATRTQVEVGGETLLLRDAVEIGRGVLVERRITLIEDQLCLVGSGICHAIVSDQGVQP